MNSIPVIASEAKQSIFPRMRQRWIAFVASLLAIDVERATPPPNRPLDLAKADAITVALAPAAHHEQIAVFEERPLDAAGQFDRLGAVPADLQQTAALIFLRAGDRAAPQEIADIHGAARGGVVHQLLHRRPVHVFEIGAADALRLVHRRRAQGDIELPCRNCSPSPAADRAAAPDPAPGRGRGTAPALRVSPPMG